MKNSRVYLEDILEAIGKIERYLNGVTLEVFYQNTEKQDAVIRQFEIIGESSGAFHRLNPNNEDLPWLSMIAMRNRLIHEYHGVDLDTVWKTAWNDLPRIKTLLLALIDLN
jgi:uncharacterized protein with HEPN domain